MNDPRVSKLRYRIKHDQLVTYEKAPALTRDTPLFTARVEGDAAVLDMKAHFAREEEAKAAVAPLLRAWEVWAGIERRPDEFEFTYEGCEIVDLRLEPGAAIGMARGTACVSGFAAIRIDRDTYPDAPDYFEASDEVVLMYNRCKQYLDGKEPPGPFANFMYTAIKGGSREQASRIAKKLGIEDKVLSKLKELGQKGGPLGARKREWVHRDLGGTEGRLLEEIVKAVIKRAGEVAADRTRNVPVITMTEIYRRCGFATPHGPV